jgi:hypothetical protein
MSLFKVEQVKISLLTDAPRHNLALMRLSAWHKAQGDEVLLNMPLWPCDLSYASVLFEKNKNKFKADIHGGPAFNGNRLGSKIEGMMPDYNLYPVDYSLGYTWGYCPRNCGFCKVPAQKNPKIHRSIWTFHDSKFKKICLLNNNTFSDPNWLETFMEIWDANLIVIDENGYDLRLLTHSKADALKHTKFEGKIHFAFDRMSDETKIINGLKTLNEFKITNTHIYVLIGYDTTLEEDIYRCQKLVDYGHDPYIMPFNQTEEEKAFKRFIDTFMWRKYKTIKEAWSNYQP